MLETFEAQRATCITLYSLSAILMTTALLTGNNTASGDVSTWWLTPTGIGASFDF